MTYTPSPDDLGPEPMSDELRDLADRILPGNREQLADARSEALHSWQRRMLAGIDLARGSDQTIFVYRDEQHEWRSVRPSAADATLRAWVAFRRVVAAGALDKNIKRAGR
jgi:hypothetical protein